MQCSYTKQKKKHNCKIFLLSFPLIVKMLIVVKYLCLIKSYQNFSIT